MTASRALPLAVFGGLVASLLFGAALTGSFGGYILFWMAPLPLFMVGLRLGLRAVAVAGLIGTAALAAFQPGLGLLFAATAALPVLLLAGLAVSQPRERCAERLVLGLTGLGLAAFAVAYFMAADQEGGLHGAATATVREAAAAAKDMVHQMMSEDLQVPTASDEWVEKTGSQLPGMLVAVWMLILAANGILAEGALARFGGGLVAAPAMASIAVPRPVSVALAAALVAAYAGKDEVAFIGVSLVEILSVPLLFGGLGVIHALLARHPARAILLTVFYAVVFGFTITLIVALGVIEQWVGLRRRFAGAPRQGEE
jgi:hypothetical protein